MKCRLPIKSCSKKKPNISNPSPGLSISSVRGCLLKGSFGVESRWRLMCLRSLTWHKTKNSKRETKKTVWENEESVVFIFPSCLSGGWQQHRILYQWICGRKGGGAGKKSTKTFIAEIRGGGSLKIKGELRHIVGILKREKSMTNGEKTFSISPIGDAWDQSRKKLTRAFPNPVLFFSP